MKKTTKQFLSWIMVLTIFFTSTFLTVGAQETDPAEVGAEAEIAETGADDYPYRGQTSSVADKWNFYSLNCTSFCAWRLNNNNGVAFHNHYGNVHWGDAKNWDDAARQLGITVDQNPAVGSIAYWNRGNYGHVAWVAQVNANQTVTIEEYNYPNKYKYNTRTISNSNPDGYIHIKDIIPPIIPIPDPVEHNPITHVDVIEGKEGQVFSYGWGYDPDDMAQPIQIHFYIGGACGDPNAECVGVTANCERTDVNSSYPNHGYYTIIDTNKRGRVPVYVYAINIGEGGNVFVGNYEVNISSPQTPVATSNNISQIPNDFCCSTVDKAWVTDYNKVHIVGWTFCKAASNTQSFVDVYVDGEIGTGTAIQGFRTLANVTRTDVEKSFKGEFPNVGSAHGFEAEFTIEKPGNHTLYFYSVNERSAVNPQIATAVNIITTSPPVKPTATPTQTPTQAPTQAATQAPTQDTIENPVADDEPQIIVSNVTTTTGSTINVPIMIKNNPGIVGITLDVSFDKNALTLTGVKDGDILGAQTHKPELASPYTLSWSNDSSEQNITANGLIATLTFTVKDNAVVGDYPIKISFDYENYDIYDVDIHPVRFETVNGTLSVRDILYGDVNDDGRVNNIDRLILTRHLARWSDYQTINSLNADVNNDGKVNNLDKVILSRHLAKWSDYSELPFNSCS